MKKLQALSRQQLKKISGGKESLDGTCLAIGSICGTAENQGKCEFVSDGHGGGEGLCFHPIN